jgi:hypothetical protein
MTGSVVMITNESDMEMTGDDVEFKLEVYHSNAKS